MRAQLERHWQYAGTNQDIAHEIYHDDAVLEFPQSGERFVGVDNFREWRRQYPTALAFEIRNIRGRDDLWVAENSISYDGGPWNLTVSASLSFEARRSPSSRSTSHSNGIRQSGGRLGEPRHSCREGWGLWMSRQQRTRVMASEADPGVFAP